MTITQAWKTVAAAGTGVPDRLATPTDRHSRAFWTGLWLAGLLGWIAIFRWGAVGDGASRAGDWPLEYQYFTVLKSALREWTIPWHTSVPLQPTHATDRFLAIPETLSPLAPQTLPLRWLPIMDVVLANVLLLYTIGVFGWRRLAIHGRWPPLVAALGFLLFAFNGHIVAHLAIGHTMWSGYYWLPWLVLPILRACERPPTLRDALELALVMGGISLQGGCHLLIWWFMFLGLFWVARPVRLAWLLAALVGGGLLVAHRFLPAVLVFNSEKVHRLEGFDTLYAVWDALVSRRFYSGTKFPWEFDYYIGHVGMVLLVVPVLGLLLFPESRRTLARLWPLALPIGVLATLSFRYVPYRLLELVPIPVLGTQRVPSRFAILPLVFAIAVACIGATNLLSMARRGVRVAAGAAGLVLAGYMLRELAQHALAWSVSGLEAIPGFCFGGQWPLPAIVAKHDPAYVELVCLSLVLSLVTLAFGAWWLYRARSVPAVRAS